MKRCMCVYLYSLIATGDPLYVGQTPEKRLGLRDREHSRAKEGSWVPFDGVLQTIGREKVVLEVVARAFDIPRGAQINALEDEMMDKYGTFYPETGRGYNFKRSYQVGGTCSEETYKARCAALSASHTAARRLKQALMMTGRVPSSETRKKLSAVWTPERKAEFSKQMQENNPSQRPEVAAKKSLAMSGKTHTFETRQKLSKIRRAWWTPENKATQAIKCRDADSPLKRPETISKRKESWTPERRAARSQKQKELYASDNSYKPRLSAAATARYVRGDCPLNRPEGRVKRIVGLKLVQSTPEWRAKNAAALAKTCQLPSSQKALKSINHVRWHANRNILKIGCEFCYPNQIPEAVAA